MKRVLLALVLGIPVACGLPDGDADPLIQTPTGKADGADCEGTCGSLWPERTCSESGWCLDSASGVSNRLTAIEALSDGSMVAVGDHGTFVRFSKGAFEGTVAGEPMSLRGVVEAADGTVWAVGSRGLIVRRNGGRWVETGSPTQHDLSAIWVGPEGELWASGEDVVLRQVDEEWVVLRDGIDMGGIRGFTAPDGQVWIALGQGSWSEILRWDGSEFHMEFTGSPADGRPRGADVTGDASGRIYALVNRATSVVKVREPDSAVWSVLFDDRQASGEDLLVSAIGALMLGGRSSVRTIDGEAEPQDAAPAGVLALAEAPDGALWAVGENGLIARRVHGSWEIFSGQPWAYGLPAVSALARTTEGLWVGRDRAYALTDGTLVPDGPFDERVGYGLAIIDLEPDGDRLWALYRDDIQGHTEVWLLEDKKWTKSFEAPAMRSLWLSPEGTLWVAGAKFLERTGPAAGRWVTEIYSRRDGDWETRRVLESLPTAPSFTDVSGINDDYVVFSGSTSGPYSGIIQLLYTLDHGDESIVSREGNEGFQCLHVEARDAIRICNGHRVLRFDGEAFDVEAEFTPTLFPRRIAASDGRTVIVGESPLREGYAGFVLENRGDAWTLDWPGVSAVASVWLEDDGTTRIGTASQAVLSRGR